MPEARNERSNATRSGPTMFRRIFHGMEPCFGIFPWNGSMFRHFFHGMEPCFARAALPLPVYFSGIEKNTDRAFSFVSAEALNGMRVVYPARAATIIFVGHEKMSVFHCRTVSL